MKMEALNNYKRLYINELAKVPSFNKVWPFWKEKINLYIPTIKGEYLFNLGDNLRDIFLSTSEHKREQKDLSGGGSAWECLVTWYLNLIFWDTPVIAMKQNKKFIPQVIYDCTTVTIANNSTNTESDIVLFTVPNAESFLGTTSSELNEFIKDNLSKIDLNIIQCKTTWNDSAQIPMLWDLVYNSKVNLDYVNVGKNGYSPSSLKRISYSFVTAPSQKDLEKKYKSTSICVLRVKNLTGGNYWGVKTKPDVAQSIKELPSRFFPHFTGGIINHLDRIIQEDDNYLNNFINLYWE